MGLKTRYAFVYPGKYKVGIALLVVEDNHVGPFAVGSFRKAELPTLFAAFDADETIIPAVSTLKFPEHAIVDIPFKRFRFIPSLWKKSRVRAMIRGNRAGPLAINAWKMVRFFIMNSDWSISTWLPSILTQEWAETYGPRKVGNAR